MNDDVWRAESKPNAEMQSKNGNAFESRRLAALRSFHSGIWFSFSGYGAPRLGSEAPAPLRFAPLRLRFGTQTLRSLVGSPDALRFAPPSSDPTKPENANKIPECKDASLAKRRDSYYVRPFWS